MLTLEIHDEQLLNIKRSYMITEHASPELKFGLNTEKPFWSLTHCLIFLCASAFSVSLR